MDTEKVVEKMFENFAVEKQKTLENKMHFGSMDRWKNKQCRLAKSPWHSAGVTSRLSYFCLDFCKIHYFSTIFIEFCTDSDELFSEFRRIF